VRGRYECSSEKHTSSREPRVRTVAVGCRPCIDAECGDPEVVVFGLDVDVMRSKVMGRRLQRGTMRHVRSVFAVLVGLLLISAIVEPLEFGLVTLVHGRVTTDPETYFTVRNQPWFLAVKLAYNTAAAVAAGFVTGWIAGRRAVPHGVALAVTQTAAFVWALASPQIRRTTPDWMWVALMLLTFAGIMSGALIQRRRLRLG